jgi:hypothetical protein
MEHNNLLDLSALKVLIVENFSSFTYQKCVPKEHHFYFLHAAWQGTRFF